MLRHVGIVFLATLCSQPVFAYPPFFVANEGQWEGEFAFRMEARGVVCYVTSSGLTMDFRQYERPARELDQFDPFKRREAREPVSVRGHVLKMNFVESNAHPELIGQDKLSSYSNYFLGRDSCRWRSFVGHYQRVLAREVWPGIDVEFVAQAEGVETLYRVKPGADPSRIVIEYEGLDAPLAVHANGRLLLRTSLGEVYENAPFAYQIIGRRQIEVPVRFELLSPTRYGLRCEGFDAQRELVIDPLVYSTFLGGRQRDVITGLSVDSLGNVVVVGETNSEQFPTTPGAYREESDGGNDGFVTKFQPDGRDLVFSTYIGGNGFEYVCGGIVDAQGSAYVVGSTNSQDWPLTPDALDTTCQSAEGFVARLSSDGATLEFSSFLGGGDTDYLLACAMDRTGLLYLAGETQSTDFPIAGNALFPQHPNPLEVAGFFAVFDPAISSLIFSSYYGMGGAGSNILDIQPAGDGTVVVGGSAYGSGAAPTTPDAYLPEFPDSMYGVGQIGWVDWQSGQLRYGSYFYGAVEEVVVGEDSVLFLGGGTRETLFPVTPGAFDTVIGPPEYTEAYVSILELPATLRYSTFVGGSEGFADLGGFEYFGGLEVEPSGNVGVCGITASSDFPVTANAFDTTYNDRQDMMGLYGDAFLCVLSPDLSRAVYSTYIGGSYNDWAHALTRDADGVIWIGGETSSANFPVTHDAFQPDFPGRPDYSSNGFVLGMDLTDTSAAVSPRHPIPGGLGLSVFPNPFNSTSTIAFTLTQRTFARLRVYDLLGREVYAMPLGWLNAGEYRRVFDASRLSSGRYFARLDAGSVTPMVVVR